MPHVTPSLTEKNVSYTSTKVPFLGFLELITIPHRGNYRTNVYCYNTSVYEVEADSENKSITDAIEWIYDNYSVPDSYTFHNIRIGDSP